MQRLKKASGQAPIALSAVSRQGVPEALSALVGIIDAAQGSDEVIMPTKGISLQGGPRVRADFDDDFEDDLP
jgi:hypothetical protein